ncbi:expressed unknown protein [Seminavis robusta]|uniref:Uncharacterized protein n=1 Tax=Seminavis robusta TaxID=568900 RepID=A0A9N8H1P2_9STRA|nr:expressed unknown protein [Seminavis robusta]|eukprot:Sro6_g004980.1 n/a (369) ;mRNA; f:67658-68764
MMEGVEHAVEKQEGKGTACNNNKQRDLAALKKEWSKLVPKEETKSLVWTKLKTSSFDIIIDNKDIIHSQVPLIVATVDTPEYRARYDDTRQHILFSQQKCQQHGQQQCLIQRPEPCYMLNLQEHPSIGVKKIVFEGWRQRLLPKLKSLLAGVEHGQEKDCQNNNVCSTKSYNQFVFVAEDDIRIPAHISPCQLVQICQHAFCSNPELDVLSLGHSWKAIQKNQSAKNNPKDFHKRNLHTYLQGCRGGGVHGATLFAIQYPTGIKRLQEALEQGARDRKQTHLDQFLFFSTLHNLRIALADPPLVGWAEVTETLTKSSSGHRRRGGGRLGFLPPTISDTGNEEATTSIVERVTWIQRQVVEKDKEKITP